MRTRTVLLLAALVLLPAAVATGQGATLSPNDYVEIQQLYARYNHAFDSSDAKLLATIFTPDAQFVAGGKARKAMEMMQGNAAAKPLPQVRHFATSVVATPSPEGARGTSYLILVNLQATPPAIIGGGFYEDILVKTPQGWRFKQRTYHSQATPAAPAAAAAR